MGWKKLKRQDSTDLQFYSDKLKSYGIFTPNSICISDDNGITNVSEISIDELQYVNNLTTDLQTTIDNTKTNILNISNYILNDFITLSTNLQANAENFSNVYSDKFNNITLDDFKATNDLKFIENNVIKGDLNVQTWVLNVSNLNKIGTNSNFYMNLIDQDNLNITSDSLSGAALNISHDFNNMGDVLSVNALNENKLKITNNGLFGLGLSNDTPSTELDVRGDIKFSGTINDVSLYELSHLSNLQTNVQQQINNIGDKLDTIGDYSSLNDIKDYCTSIQDVFINQVNNVLSDSSNVTITQKENASNFSLSVTDYLTNEKQDKIFFNVNDFNYDIDNNSLHLKANLKPWTVSVYTDDQTIGDYNFNGSNYLHNNNGEIKIFEDTIIKVTSDVRDLITTDDSSSKQNIITGSATSLLNQSTNFNFGEILVTDNNGKITTHPLDTSNLHFLINDTTSNLQQQFDDIRENITYSSNSIKTHIDDLVINTSNYVENNFPDTTNYIDNIDVNTDNGLTFDSSNLSFNGTITIEQDVGQESYWTCNVDLNNISYLSYSNVNVYNDGIYFDKFEEKLPVIVSNNSKVSLSDVTQNEDSYTYSFTHGEGNYITFPFDVNVDILMVGGGGSGGKDNGYGGEGGEIKVANIDLQKDVIYNVTVGKGGDATLYEKGGTTYAFGETARGGNPGLSSSYNYVGKKLKYPPVSLFNSENSSNEENIKEVIDEYYGNGTYKYIHNNDHLQNVYNVDGSYDTANHTPEFIDNPGSVVSIILPYKIILTEVSFIYDNTIEGRPNTFSVYGLNDEGEYILIGNNEIIETVDIADSTMKIMKSSITNDQYYRDYKISVTSITPSSNILTFHEIELYGTSIYVNNYIKFENTTISDYPLLSLPGKNYDDTLSSIDEIGENSGSGGDGGILDENGKNGKDGVVVVKWINQKTSYIQKVITENDLKSQTDISFSEDFVYNQEKNTLGLRNVEWNDNNVYIKHKNTKVFSNDIKIPEGDVYVDTIITSNIQPHYSLPSMKLGNNIEIHNPNYSDNFQKVIEIETIKSSLKPVEISESTLAFNPTMTGVYTHGEFLSPDDNEMYEYAQFTGNGTITFSKNIYCDILMVGAGGAGSGDTGGGGGAGKLIFFKNVIVPPGDYSINIGIGGICPSNAAPGGKGSDTQFKSGSTLLVKAEGGGGSGNNNGDEDGGSGAGGDANPKYENGNANEYNPILFGVSGTALGNNGGNRKNTTYNGQGGGGGGAGEVGQNASMSSLIYAGKGGDGVYEIDGINLNTTFDLSNNNLGVDDGSGKYYLAGGGGGGSELTAPAGIGGKGGGGDGGKGVQGIYPGNNGANAIDNTGSGGGGGSNMDDTKGGSGGSGLFIIRWPKYVILSDILKSYISDDNKKYSYIQFNSEDIISFGKDTVCDVLVVGGGGAGNPAKGGGSSGGILYYSGVNFSENTNYSIQVGRGGVLEGEAGEQSSVSGTNVSLIAVGGLGSSTNDGASSGTSITNTITLPSTATENLNLVPKNGADGFNIVGEDIYTKYPRENMTGDTKTYTDGTIIRCRSSEYFLGNVSFKEHNIFDGTLYSTGSRWISGNGSYSSNGVIATSKSAQYFNTDTAYYGEYVIIDLGEQIVLGKYIIYPVNNDSLVQSPKDFRIYATNTDSAYFSSTDTNWIQIDEQTNITGWINNTSKEFVLGTVPIAYRYYAIIINKSNSDPYVNISEWELFVKRPLAIVGGGGGTGTDAPELTSSTSIPDGGDATIVNIYGDDIYLAGGGGGMRDKSKIRQFPRQAMTSSTTTYDVEGKNVTVKIKASSQSSSYPAWKLFNGDDGTSTTSEVRAWISTEPSYIGDYGGAKYSDSGDFYAKTDYRGQFIAIDLGENIIISEIKLWQNMQESPSYRRRRTPRNYRLYGSNDQNAYDNIQGGDWTEIFDKVDTYFSSEIPPINPVHDIFTNTLSFRYYVLVINRIYHYRTLDSEWLSFGELELFGSVIGGSITGSQQGGGTYGYGGNSLLTTHTAGGDGLVIIKWEEDPSLFTSYCLRANKNIWFDESTVVYTSDARIKKDIQDIDDDQALQKILELQPKTYKYIDHLNKGNNDVYGFISQQVRDIFPEATNTISNYIPNIYDICEYVNDIITLPQNIDISTFGLSQDSNLSVKLINNRRETLYTDCVLMETETGYGLQVKNIDNFIGNTSNIFVYGTKVDDMVTLDKSYLFTLNVCATQILNRKVITLEQKNNDLLSRIDELENEISQIEISNTSNY